ncbi:BREX-1 system adenine-specific DNA-methyltransferase PglX [Amycolatopsis benzoatilytica]|uniref:BREX-1 system adenine-specific DNA-methyltransferase PglX n=1 Tax=Amycolatopsis benzoatilytica TaxID=346045 RepID=UPI00036FBD8E|nr:BREX-1 system adenine-specific DNA-methyltransferase PglX [Amycolatopsis benzoatilytica]
METAPLKSFATWARTTLIREVTARVAVVLAQASSERVEQPRAVEALEKAVSASGGGDKGKAAVTDRVAYTWFNRIIALRFMDANGYTGIGVVSPQPGVETGQPEILAEAKRGNIEAAVVGTKTRDTVTALLNGTRRSDDAQGEAYALLLADYCRYWNRAMPFMFEREGDFTELLIPANLLADGSVASRAAKELTKDVCQDVEVIGWLYQFYISERKDEVFAGFKKNKKAGADEIPAATQLFTPHWIVRYLVENSLGRLWMLNRPSSGLVNQMAYYIAPVDEETDFLKIASPEELTVVDPACGSGHMLTYAFDLLYAIYEEEGYAPAEIPSLILTTNLYGVEIDPRAGALAAFALTMKARAKQRTFFNKQIEPNVCVLDPIRFTPDEVDLLLTPDGDQQAETAFWNQFAQADNVGSLIRPNEPLIGHLRMHLGEHVGGRGELLAQDVIERAYRVIHQADVLLTRYTVAVANPPYLGGRSMGVSLAAFAKDWFFDSKSDLFAMFIERNASLVVPGGYVGMITMQSWMFLRSYEVLRRNILKNQAILTMAHLGSGAFDTIAGEVVSTTAFVFVNAPDPQHRGLYFRLIEERGEAAKGKALLERRATSEAYAASAADFERVPGEPIAYWLSPQMLTAFQLGHALEEIGAPRQGMATSDNGRFTRRWFEVPFDRLGIGMTRDEARSSGRRWFPYNKGGEYRKWYGNQDVVVDWEHDGREVLGYAASKYGSPTRTIKNIKHYFEPSISWSKVGAGIPTFRYFPQGFVFDVAGTSIFAPEATLLELAAFCNSSVAHAMLQATSPTLNFEVGTLARLPVTKLPDSVIDAVRNLIEIHRLDWNRFETSWDFQTLDTITFGAQRVSEAFMRFFEAANMDAVHARDLEIDLNVEVAKAYGLESEIDSDVPLMRITLIANPAFRYGQRSLEEHVDRFNADCAEDLISYAVGCMFGRYSLDEPGLILAGQGSTVQDYLAKVSNPTFAPDEDNVIPVVDGDWFEDDIVARFRAFLRVAFGEQHFEENLRFVTKSLGVKDIRDYFVKSFYKDHVQRYKKRPIYWLFSSPKGSFNALIYMHRYTPSTVSTVLNEYLREFRAKLTASLPQQERLAAGSGPPRQQAAAQKEADRLRKVLLELEEYEHDVLYPLASRQLTIDLDDGVKANYPKFGAALKKIPGLGGGDE